MNREIVFSTDAATLAVFDPATLTERVDDEEDWWAMEFHQLPEVAAGRITLIGLGSDGVYRVRVTDGGLEPAEKAYACQRVALGIEVVAGGFFVGAGELLPGDGCVPTPEDFGSHYFETANGPYKVEAYSILWSRSPDWQVPAGQPIPAGTPPDVVVVVKPRSGRFTKPKEEPRLFYSWEWLFPNEPRRVGPAPGMIVATVVVARGRERLLKPDEQWGYRPVLADMGGLAWKDRLEVRVLEVDHQEKSFKAELVRQLPREE